MRKVGKLRWVYAVIAMCTLSSHAAAWTFYSDIDGDSSKWSKYGTYSINSAGADRYTNLDKNMFVRIWAGKDKWSSAGRTVPIPHTTGGFCIAQITHTGKAGYFYVRDSATYTNLSPLISVVGSALTPENDRDRFNKASTYFYASDKNIFARFYLQQGGISYTGGPYGQSDPYTAYIDDLTIVCL